jgi:hypothetical protein
MMSFWATWLVILNGFWLLLGLPMLPGNWLMVATTAAVAWWQWEKGMFNACTLVAIWALSEKSIVCSTAAPGCGFAWETGPKQ